MSDATALADHAHELLVALGRLDATLVTVRRNAGRGRTPELDRALHAHLRSLRALGGHECATLAEDVVDAAQRVLDSADPSAPLLVLSMAQRTLDTRLRRQAALIPVLPSAA